MSTSLTAPTGTSRRMGRPPVTSTDEVVSAVLRVLDAKGLANLTMRAVADELGVNVATVYNHVGNKERLLLLAVQEAERQLPAEMLPLLDDVQDWREVIRLYSLGLYREAVRHPGMLDLFLSRQWIPAEGAAPALLDRAVELAEAEGVDMAYVASTLVRASRTAVGLAMYECSTQVTPLENRLTQSAQELADAHPSAARLVVALQALERDHELIADQSLRALLWGPEA